MEKLILVKYGRFNLSKEARTDKLLIEFLSSHMPRCIRPEDFNSGNLYDDCITLATMLLGNHMNMNHIREELIEALESKDKETLINMFYENLEFVMHIEYVSCFKDRLFTIAVNPIDELTICESIQLITELYNEENK